MARAYATLAAGGSRPTPFGIAQVSDSDGETLDKSEPKSVAVMDPAVAYLTTDILKGVIARGTGTAADIGRPAAGKTGTTQEYRDAWFVGYTPDLVTAVWVGYPEAQREMKSVHGRSVTGGSFPAQIWASFMRAALADTKPSDFVRPTGLETAKICADTGDLATEFCPNTRTGLFLSGHKPGQCEEHTTPTEVEVPSLVGKTKIDALAQLEKAYLKVAVVEREIEGVEAGTVGSQKPAAGQTVKPETVVTIVVSTGGGVNQPPVADFTAPESASVGEVVSLDAGASTADGTIAKYYWEFGDGATGTGKTVTHAWSALGPFEITLWITDDKNLQSSVTKTITIQ
jgi:membrane peptidoglycan carboxypeptidase